MKQLDRVLIKETNRVDVQGRDARVQTTESDNQEPACRTESGQYVNNILF